MKWNVQEISQMTFSWFKKCLLHSDDTFFFYLQVTSDTGAFSDKILFNYVFSIMWHVLRLPVVSYTETPPYKTICIWQ